MALWNGQIEKVFANQKLFDGVFKRGSLPTKLARGHGFVANLRPQEEIPTKGGSHWVACVWPPNQNYCMYFDSYGVYPTDDIVELMQKTGSDKIKYSTINYQPIDSELCGYYCIYFLTRVFQGEDPYDILHKELDIRNPKNNDKIVRKYGPKSL